MATIRKRGTKWQVQIRRKGFPELSISFVRKGDASEWARLWEAKADRRDLPPNRKSLDATTLSQLVERYRDQVVSRKRGAEIETIILNRFLRERICRKKLSAITTADFAAYRDRRLTEISSKSLARQLSPLRNMFNVAQNEWDLPLGSNPLAKLSLKVTDKKRDRRLRPGEWERLSLAAENTRNPLIWPVVEFALETAMRRGEILALRWDHVDLERRSVAIPESKNGYSRKIPLTPKALAILERLTRSGERVFALSANALRLSWVRITKRAGISDLHFHDLRHEAISRFFELGLTVPEVASISGHRDLRMLMRYAHASQTRILRLISELNLTEA